MQFTTATVVLVATMLSAAGASPIVERAQMCGAAPTASGSQTPLSTPSAATAEACHKLCEANTACKSFVFGLPPDASAPTCELFGVPGSQVPVQGTNLMVYDDACDNIPTTEPTEEHPQGTTGSSDSADSKSGSDGEQDGGRRKRDVCGAAPTGSSSQTPLVTKNTITTVEACLALCKATTGCKSIEFGRPSANGELECLLFSVPASSLPAPTSGQTFVAYDVAC